MDRGEPAVTGCRTPAPDQARSRAGQVQANGVLVKCEGNESIVRTVQSLLGQAGARRCGVCIRLEHAPRGASAPAGQTREKRRVSASPRTIAEGPVRMIVSFTLRSSVVSTRSRS